MLDLPKPREIVNKMLKRYPGETLFIDIPFKIFKLLHILRHTIHTLCQNFLILCILLQTFRSITSAHKASLRVLPTAIIRLISFFLFRKFLITVVNFNDRFVKLWIKASFDEFVTYSFYFNVVFADVYDAFV